MHTGNKVYEALKLLRPYDIDLKKIRLGSRYDGGYVMVDNMTPDQVVLSYGLGGEISFDAEMANRGHQCYMFDHTIQGLPMTHPNFHYYAEGVAGSNRSEKPFYTVEEHLERFSIRGNRLILKMDVEGAEWDAMSRMPDAVLARFEQVAIEMHEFGSMREAAFLEKVRATLERLNRHFTLYHVHANNNNPMESVAGFPVFNLLELSYVKTAIVKRSPSRTFYPTDLDSPNEQDRPDYILSAFPFWPEGLTEAEYDAFARKMDAQNEAIAASMRLIRESGGHVKAAEIDRAEACLREALELRPGLNAALVEMVNVLNSKAVSRFNAQDFVAAVAALREALEIVPHHPDIKRNLDVALSAQAASTQR